MNYKVIDAAGEVYMLEGTKLEIDADRSRTTVYDGEDVVFSGVGVRSAGKWEPAAEVAVPAAATPTTPTPASTPTTSARTSS